MKLRSLESRNFRNLESRQWDFHPTANVIVGDNGQGKTNLLEAIYFLATTKSFRTPRLANIARLGQENVFVQGTVEHGAVAKTLGIGLQSGEERRRELQVNGQKVTLSGYIQTLQVLAYSSSQLEILRGGPEWRRRFVDRGVAGLKPAHLNDISRYTRVVRQRNALLESVATGRSRAAVLDAWDEELVQSAKPLVESRAAWVAELREVYSTIAAAHHYHVTDLEIAYEPSLSGEIDADRATVISNRPRDLRLRHTTSGPHRDELRISRQDLPAVEFLSSGEIKMTVLFLTLAALEIFRRKFDYAPLFLLDDIDAELDLGILQRLVAYLVSATQLFTTSAKEPFLDRIELGEHRKFMLRQGSLNLWKDVAS